MADSVRASRLLCEVEAILDPRVQSAMDVAEQWVALASQIGHVDSAPSLHRRPTDPLRQLGKTDAIRVGDILRKRLGLARHNDSRDSQSHK